MGRTGTAAVLVAVALLVACDGPPHHPGDASAIAADSAPADGTRADGSALPDGAAPGDAGSGDGALPDSSVSPVSCSPGCGPGAFCQAARGTCAGEGTCSGVPSDCPDTYMPVCGCDDVTYGNDCERQAARESLQYEGECVGACTSVPPEFCCFDDLDCAEDERCHGEICGVDVAGRCKETLPAPLCWSNDDCPPGKRCEDVSLCPCMSLCFVADMPGTCM